MPRLRPDGTRMGGAEQRAADEEARRKREVSLVDDGSAYPDLTESDRDNPETGLMYVRKCQMVAFAQICKAVLPFLEKAKLIREFSAVIGMTHPRAALETKASKLESGQNRGRVAGSARIEKRVAKPDTARGAAKAPRTRPAEREGGGPVGSGQDVAEAT